MPDTRGSPARAFALVFLLAFALRAALFLLWAENHLEFYALGGETGRVALSLIRSGRFADPYMIPTGPTAHPTPLWPAMLALIYGTFGITPTAGCVRALVAISSYSVLCGLMPWLARLLGLSTRAGLLAGTAAALLPLQGLDEFLGYGVSAHAALAMAVVTTAFARRWRAPGATLTDSLLLGLACGAAFHVSPPLLLVVCGCLLFELRTSSPRRNWRATACIALGAALVCVPWTCRNVKSLGGWFFIRSNFGLELRIANHDGAAADIEVTLARQGTLRHPSENIAEARLVQELGEAEYMRRARAEAFSWITAHPAEFLRLSTLRFLHFWCGPPRVPWLAVLSTVLTVLALVGLRRAWPVLDAPARAALLIPLLTFPLVYYGVSYVGHYPAPLNWLLLLLAASAFAPPPARIQ